VFWSSKLSNLEKINLKQQQKNQYRLSNPDKSEADRFEEVLNAIKISKVRKIACRSLSAVEQYR
jgi:phosphoketolase